MKSESAFPCPSPCIPAPAGSDRAFVDLREYGQSPPEGMTVLDYFAANALKGILSGRHVEPDPSDNARWEIYAFDAYHYAEAMLAEKRRREALPK